MINKRIVSFLTAASLSLASVGNAIACTTLLITDTSGNAYHGRTMEFSVLMPGDLSYFPAATTVVSSAPDGKKGLPLILSTQFWR